MVDYSIVVRGVIKTKIKDPYVSVVETVGDNIQMR